jgi:type II secretory pathway component GspD/PulD (secretin)
MRSTFRLLPIMLLAATVGAASAQTQTVQVQYDRALKTVTVDAANADVTRVVRALFAETGGARYTLDPRVTGRVTLHVKNLAPEAALKSILEPVGATYQMEGGLCHIVPSGSSGRTISEVPAAFRARVGVNAQDQLLTPVLATLSRSTGVAIKLTNEVPTDLRVTITAGNAPLWDVLQRIAVACRLKLEATGEREATLSPLTSVIARRRDGYVGSSREG